jgi:hypothetical protein
MSDDIIDQLRRIANGEAVRFAAPPKTRAEQIITNRMTRELCTQAGHQYQVHGKANPHKIECKRCHVTWAIGARTEPPQ